MKCSEKCFPFSDDQTFHLELIKTTQKTEIRSTKQHEKTLDKVLILYIMDSTWILTGQHVCFHSAMKYKNDLTDMIGCILVVRIYSFIKEIKIYVHALYIVFV